MNLFAKRTRGDTPRSSETCEDMFGQSGSLRVPIRMTRGRDTVDCGAGQGARATTAQKAGRRARATPACDTRCGVPSGCDENGRLPRQDSSPHHLSGAASSPFLAFNPFWSQRGSRGILIGTLKYRIPGSGIQVSPQDAGLPYGAGCCCRGFFSWSPMSGVAESVNDQCVKVFTGSLGLRRSNPLATGGRVCE